MCITKLLRRKSIKIGTLGVRVSAHRSMLVLINGAL